MYCGGSDMRMGIRLVYALRVDVLGVLWAYVADMCIPIWMGVSEQRENGEVSESVSVLTCQVVAFIRGKLSRSGFRWKISTQISEIMPRCQR
jgi:hypothetical protein